MIEMVSRSGQPEAMLCPALVCDTCRDQVTGHGNVLWSIRHEPQWESSPLFVSHKGQCHRALKYRIAIEYPIAAGWSQLWNEAGDFMRHLTHNAVQSFADDPDGSYRIVPVIHPGRN